MPSLPGGPENEFTFLQDPHAVGIISFLAQVMSGRDHLGAQPGSQPGLGSVRQLTAAHTTTLVLNTCICCECLQQLQAGCPRKIIKAAVILDNHSTKSHRNTPQLSA